MKKHLMRSYITMSKVKIDNGPFDFQIGWNFQRAIKAIFIHQGHWWKYLLAICVVRFSYNRTHTVMNDTDTADVDVVAAVPSSFILYYFPSSFSFAIFSKAIAATANKYSRSQRSQH